MKVLIVATACVIFACAAAQAATLSYVISGRGSGALGGAAFSDAAFTFTLRGDTANYTSGFGTSVIDPLDSAQVRIAGLGVTVFEIGTRFGYNANTGLAFFSRTGSTLGRDLFDFSLASAPDLTRGFGSVIGTDVIALDQFQDVATSLGALSFDASSDVTLTAVPAPAAGLLLIAALGGLAALRRRPG